MAEVLREHFNLYYIFLYDKQSRPPPDERRRQLMELLFPKKE